MKRGMSCHVIYTSIGGTMKKIVPVLILVLSMVCLLNLGCKKSDVGRFTLTVVRSDGIDGFPEAGTYTYDQDNMVFYKYDTLGAYANPRITIDNQDAPLNGSITMDLNHTLQVTCDSVDYSGDWQGTYAWAIHNGGMCIQPDNATDEDIFLVHAGESLTITIPSEDLVLTGSIYGDSYFAAEQEKRLADDEVIYEYMITGKFVSVNKFSGELKILGYKNSRDRIVCGSSATFTGTKK